MFQLTTIRRRLLLGGGSVVLLLGLSLVVAHTKFVRRFVLVQAQIKLGNALGLVVDAKELDYNLLLSQFELKDITLKGIHLEDMPAPVRAQRIRIAIPVWRLIGGSLETAQIRVDGLSVRWFTARDGRSNWPAVSGNGGGGNAQPPAILVASGQISVQDDRDGLLLRLPVRQFSGRWDAASSKYLIAGDAGAGSLQWNNSRLPLDAVQLKSTLSGGGFSIESLRMASGGCELAIQGSLGAPAGAPPRIEASGDLKLDLGDLSRALSLASPLSGHLDAHLSATGAISALQLHGTLRGGELLVSGTEIHRPEAEMTFDTLSGEVRLKSFSAGVLGGRLSGGGRLWTGADGGRSQLTASLDGIGIGEVARLFGAAEAIPGQAAVEVSASWPGLDWQAATLSGGARSRSAKVVFTATGHAHSVTGSFDSSLDGLAAMHADMGIDLTTRAIAGIVRGNIDSLARFSSLVEGLLNRPAGSLNPQAIDGRARWSGTVSGTAALPSASIQFDGKGLSAGAWTGGDLQVTAHYAANRIGIERARLAWGRDQIEAKGEIGGTSAHAPLNLEGTIEGSLPSEAWGSFEGAVSGGFRIAGSIANPVAETTLQTGALTAFGERFSRTSLDARLEDGEITLDSFAAEQDQSPGSPGRFEASGRVNLTTGRYEIKAAGRDLRPRSLALPGGQPVTATLSMEAHGEGLLSDPVLHAQLDARDVKVGDAAVGGLHAQLDAAGHSATVSLAIPEFNLHATSTVAMQGAWPLDLKMETRDTRFPGGSFDASVNANATLAPLHLEKAAATIDNFRLAANGVAIRNDGPIELSFADDRIRVGKLALESGRSKLRLSGEMPLQNSGAPGSLSIEGNVDLGLLPHSPIAGFADVSATVTGSAQTWQPAGSLTIRDGRLRGQPIPLPIEHISGRVNLQDGVIRLEETSAKAGAGTLRMEGSLPLRLISNQFPAPSSDAAQPARFSAQLERLDLSSGSGDHTATATIAAKLQAEAPSLSLAAVRAEVEFTELNFVTKKGKIQQNGPTRIAIADGAARLEHLDIGGPQESMRASGSMGLSAGFPLQLQASGEGDLAFLSLLAAPLEAAGAVQLDVRVNGTLNAPQTTGFVKLAQASIVLPDPRLQAANINMRADLEGDHVTVKQLSGNLNGGSFTGGGELRVGTEGLRDVNLFFHGKDVSTDFPTFVKTTSSLDVKLVSRENRLVLEGQIEAQDGFLDAGIESFAQSDKSLDIGPEGSPNPASNPVALDIKVVTKRPVEMDNNLGRISATADLRLAGTVKKVGLLGTLNLEEDGKLYFGDRTYYIERGTVRFAEDSKVTPELNIQAYTRTGDYTIRLGLTGKLDELTTTFTSDPPLSRDDVIAVLLTGKTVAENRGVDLRALEAASLATGAMNSALSGELHRAIGISRVSVQPGAIAAESNNPGARLTITQDFTSSLRMLYSMNLSDGGDQIWVGEYDLSRRFTTRMVKDSDNNYRGEFRHDIRFGSSSSVVGNASAGAVKRTIAEVHFTGAAPFSDEALAKVFKVKPGQQYKAIKVRKGSERLSKFLVKNGYVESRVRLDRKENGLDMALTVRIELGPAVELAYQGANLPKREQSRVRGLWHGGISDQQRPQSSKEAILGYFVQKGFLGAQADVQIVNGGGLKTVTFDMQPGRRYRGVKMLVEGARGQHARQILVLLHDRRMTLAAYRDPGKVVEAITRYYRQRGYLAAKVSPPVQNLDAARRTGNIVISVVEGPAYRVGNLNFQGNLALGAADLRTGVPLESGAVFEPSRLDPTATALRQKYGKLGYREAQVEYTASRHDDLGTVDVSFHIVENNQTSIGAVTIEGNHHTSDEFALSRLRIETGDPADTESIKESIKNLSQTGAYTSADLKVGPPAPSGAGDKPEQVADIVVAVSEPKPFRLLYGGLYDSGDGPGFIADFQILNSLGAGRTVGLRTRKDSETDEVRLYLTQPFWGQRHLTTTVATYFTRETEYHQNTPTEKLGVSIQQDFQRRSKWLLSYGYRYEKQRGFVPDPAAPMIPVEVVTVAPLTFTLSRDSRDSFLDATRGSFISHGFELAPRFLGSDYPYVRYYGQYFRYFSLIRPQPVPFGEKEQRSRLVFATATRLGVQKGFDATGAVLTDRFYAGGGTTVRGFGQDELGPKLANGDPAGGNAVLILNEELRYPLVGIFDAVTFVDTGNVFPRVSDFRLSELRTAAGFGLRIRNPFVVLRFDYGFKLNRRPGESAGAFFFSIGQAF